MNLKKNSIIVLGFILLLSVLGYADSPEKMLLFEL